MARGAKEVTVRTLSLGMGTLSLIVAILAAVVIWIIFESSLQGLRMASTFPTSTSLASASCESLQEMCPVLARRAQSLLDVNDALGLGYERLYRFVLFGVLGWGALSGAAFLFIYARTRQHGSNE
jgi:hypothetical protein